jgi:hypothetical protein
MFTQFSISGQNKEKSLTSKYHYIHIKSTLHSPLTELMDYYCSIMTHNLFKDTGLTLTPTVSPICCTVHIRIQFTWLHEILNSTLICMLVFYDLFHIHQSLRLWYPWYVSRLCHLFRPLVADFPTVEAWFRYLAHQNGICGSKRGTRKGFPSEYFGSTLQIPIHRCSIPISIPFTTQHKTRYWQRRYVKH